MKNRKLELLKFIGINTSLITDFRKMHNPESPDVDTLLQIINLYQENEEYRNELELITKEEHSAQTWEFLEFKLKYEPNNL